MGKTTPNCLEPLGFGCLPELRVFAVTTDLVFASNSVARDLSLRDHAGDSTNAQLRLCLDL